MLMAAMKSASLRDPSCLWPRDRQGRADQMARSIEVFGRILGLDELLDQIRAVTVEQARSAGAALLDAPAAVASVGAKLALAA